MAEAARMNEGKPELGYLLEFPTAIEAFARVKMLGAAKYERGNWKKGGKPDNEYLDACLRHMTAFANGEEFASDSGCHHLAHAAWNLFALLELNYPGVTHDPELFNKMMTRWRMKKMVTDPDVKVTPKFEIKDAHRVPSFDKMVNEYCCALDRKAGLDQLKKMNNPFTKGGSDDS